MIARERGRKLKGVGIALVMTGVIGTDAAYADGPIQRAVAAKARANAESAPPPAAAEQPKIVIKAVPVNPTDPICIVNGRVITRQRLNDECVARKGEEILETLIARELIEQALEARKLQVTAAEVDQEIENVAQAMAGVGREAWLRTLAKERGISPTQYARDIIYPSLALRKLSAHRVQVTEKDVQVAFEAQYGDKLRCRLIMVDKLAKAQQVWDELRKNPGGFEKLAQDYSMDNGSRSLGGLLAEPIARHASPQTVSDAAFRQLVDGDPNDKNPNNKPKDGDYTGPIQVAEATWVILKRESVVPPRTDASLKNEAVRKQTYDMIYEVKLKEAMNLVFSELMEKAAIDNKLTGHVKLAEEANQQNPSDHDVKLMSNPAGATSAKPGSSARPVVGSAPKIKTPPVGAPQDDTLEQQTEALRNAPIRK